MNEKQCTRCGCDCTQQPDDVPPIMAHLVVGPADGNYIAPQDLPDDAPQVVKLALQLQPSRITLCYSCLHGMQLCEQTAAACADAAAVQRIRRGPRRRR